MAKFTIDERLLQLEDVIQRLYARADCQGSIVDTDIVSALYVTSLTIKQMHEGVKRMQSALKRSGAIRTRVRADGRPTLDDSAIETRAIKAFNDRNEREGNPARRAPIQIADYETTTTVSVIPVCAYSTRQWLQSMNIELGKPVTLVFEDQVSRPGSDADGQQVAR